ncbi:MAG: ferredoxin-type protein NapF [Alphaproteobacteria bacterium]|nr:ferredoxin-type protein NapF [Alphaproteobacteria bacterium]MBU1548616.1 ferredoxin-type protein NapF [Alphaproteobacteria bacterium]MBU2334422.1 ferredoxin-type protein NapF [Alphaproteobacteria bacterium]MBU2388486.1 ferredoxin-type protein NapF [Alphaproteobacteria bacterium]
MPMGILSRRDFLRGHTQSSPRVLPPGFLGPRPDVCSNCTLCIDHCPTSILIADEQGGPAVDFSRGECTLCGECRAACPHSGDLFDAAFAFPHHAQIEAGCLTHRGVDCQACRDYCPTTAIRFRPRIGGPFQPEIDVDACNGCGACIAVCPVGAVSVTARQELVDA